MDVMSESARREKIEAELENAKDEKHGYLRLPWKGQTDAFHVIRLDLDAVVLNTNSHRIRSQILSHERGEEILDNPYSGWAQEEVAEILRHSKTSEGLKGSLKNEGQRDPGVITRAGVLVNANRRATALRDLNKQYILVAVLPGDPSQAEINELELQLQMQENYKDAYSLTNQLLFIREFQTERSYSDKRIAAMMSESEEEVQRLTRFLALVEEALEMSKVNGKPQVPLTYFDERVQGLTDLDKDYEAKKRTDPRGAELLRTTRLIGILAGAKYQTLRELDDDFFTSYFREPWEEAAQSNRELPDFDTLVGSGEGGDDDEEEVDELGLGVLGGEGGAPDPIDPTPFLRLIAQSHKQDVVHLSDEDGDEAHMISRETLIKYTNTVLDAGAEEARFDKNLENRLQKPAERLRMANKHLSRVLADMTAVQDHPQWDQEEFMKRFGETSRSLREIEEHIKHLANSKAPREES